MWTNVELHSQIDVIVVVKPLTLTSLKQPILTKDQVHFSEFLSSILLSVSQSLMETTFSVKSLLHPPG